MSNCFLQQNGPLQTKILQDQDILVDREKFCKATNAGIKHRNTTQLLGKIIRLVFSEEELAHSRGQGMRNDKTDSEKPPS